MLDWGGMEGLVSRSPESLMRGVGKRNTGFLQRRTAVHNSSVCADRNCTAHHVKVKKKKRKLEFLTSIGIKQNLLIKYLNPATHSCTHFQAPYRQCQLPWDTDNNKHFTEYISVLVY